VLLVPYAVLGFKFTVGRETSEPAVLRVERRDTDGVGGMSCSERGGEIALLLESLLPARVERLVDMMDGSRPEL
jgi:hypothetical protein